MSQETCKYWTFHMDNACQFQSASIMHYVSQLGKGVNKIYCIIMSHTDTHTVGPHYTAVLDTLWL